jgi:glycine oxidase
MHSPDICPDTCPDICIAGAGIIGLSLALELHQRGLRVIILDRGAPLSEASTAAAGMLAAADPDNPPQLRALAALSLSLYSDFLQRLHTLSGYTVPFQTHTTLQSISLHDTKNRLTQADLSHLLPALISGDHHFALLDEHSLDPRQLAPAVLAAVKNTTIDLRPDTSILSTEATGESIQIHTLSGTIHAHQFIDCTGSWSDFAEGIPVSPKKGQMLYVDLPPKFPLHFVIRTPSIYIVPRTTGPNAGRALIGATIEDAGFDKTVYTSDIDHLRAFAAALLPSFNHLEPIETWAGLRPATSDGLPLIGPHPTRPHHYLATGHYRNGILLAPATAHVIAQLITGETPSVELAAFSPARNLPVRA